ncbi:MAG: hypothetical protein V1831_00940 [Candidatus Woesearchaeota archaeon]
MRKSQYGTELIFLWEGWKSPEQIQLIPTSSTLQINDQLQRKIDTEWEKAKKANPLAHDAPKWRTERVHDDGAKLLIYVSEIKYSQHNVLRHQQNQQIGFYPNPITINVVQETSDGYIPLGIRGRGSDQEGLCLMGSAFVERHEKDGVSKDPEKLGYVVQKKCLEENVYNCRELFDMTDARAMNVIFGSNHDTTVGFYLPIFPESNQVSVASVEHKDILFLSNKLSSIQTVLNNGSYNGIPAADHLLGCLESYLVNQRNGNITPQYQNK